MRHDSHDVERTALLSSAQAGCAFCELVVRCLDAWDSSWRQATPTTRDLKVPPAVLVGINRHDLYPLSVSYVPFVEGCNSTSKEIELYPLPEDPITERMSCLRPALHPAKPSDWTAFVKRLKAMLDCQPLNPLD